MSLANIAASGRYPRLNRHVVLVPIEEGVVVDGLARLEVIKGPLAQTVVPTLLDSLDGTRALDDILALFPDVPPAYINTALALLHDWNLLSYKDEPTCVVEKSNTLAFLDRLRIQLGQQANALPTTPIELTIIDNHQSPCLATVCLQRLLTASGIFFTSVARFVTSSMSVNRNCDRRRVLIVVSIGGEDVETYEHLRRLSSTCTRMTWLRAVYKEGEYADVGPWFDGAATDHCYSCFLKTHCGIEGVRCPASPKLLDQYYWASTIALEVITSLALTGSGLVSRQFERVRDFSGWTSRRLGYGPVPGCDVCLKYSSFPLGAANLRQEPATDTALLFESLVGLKARTVIPQNPTNSTQQGSYNERADLSFPNSEHVHFKQYQLPLSMPVTEALTRRKTARREPLSAKDLSALLQLTAGYRDSSSGVGRRWAPTAGNLGSTRLFAIVRNISGILAGTYYYDAKLHAISAIRKRPRTSVEELFTSILERTSSFPDLLIVVVGSFYDVGYKYGPFGYRLAAFDAGVAMVQLRVVARSLKIWSRPLVVWPSESLIDNLRLRASNECIFSVIEVSRVPCPVVARTERTSAGFDSWKVIADFQDLDLEQVTDLLIRESEVCSGPSLDNQETIRTKAERLINFSVPTRCSSRSVGSVLNERVSLRSFSDNNVPISVLSTILSVAYASDRRDWAELHGMRSSSLGALIIAQGVQGLTPAIYEYDPHSHGVIWKRPALSKRELQDLLVQEEFVDAPLFIWLFCDLARTCTALGAFGHRKMMVRAGAMAYSLWLSALGCGLRGTIVAGLVPGAARTLLDLDEYRRLSLVAFACGYACGPIATKE